MTRSTPFRARALALLCLGAAISSSVLAVPVQSAPLHISSDPTLNGAEPLAGSSRVMCQTSSEVATPQCQADCGHHRDSGVLTVDDSEHDRVGNDRAPSTSISANLDFLSKYCGGDDSKATPRDPINPFEVQEIYDGLGKGLDYLKRYVDLTGKKKNLPKANPDRVKEILHYANEISKSIEATPSPPQSSQKNDLTILDNHTLLTRFYCYQIYKLDDRAMPKAPKAGFQDAPLEVARMQEAHRVKARIQEAPREMARIQETPFEARIWGAHRVQEAGIQEALFEVAVIQEVLRVETFIQKGPLQAGIQEACTLNKYQNGTAGLDKKRCVLNLPSSHQEPDDMDKNDPKGKSITRTLVLKKKKIRRVRKDGETVLLVPSRRGWFIALNQEFAVFRVLRILETVVVL
ncbi:hypothetical protein EV360DRAFT_74951 [Lentinula raphanica]|nr:hypothetical protein EV360DRAFT_74951 [Lentinula raphanica]